VFWFGHIVSGMHVHILADASSPLVRFFEGIDERYCGEWFFTEESASMSMYFEFIVTNNYRPHSIASRNHLDTRVLFRMGDDRIYQKKSF
jgi:hypothetical protein